MAGLDRGGRAGAHALDPVRVGGDAARAPVHDDRWLGHLAADDSRTRTTLVAWRARSGARALLLLAGAGARWPSSPSCS